MLSIWYSSEDFPEAIQPSGLRKLDFNWCELLWASITVGRAPDTLIDFFMLNELLSRIYFVAAHLDETPSGALALSSLYGRLDPTEKGWASYRIGMIMTKLLAAKILGVDWLVHLDTSDWDVHFAEYLLGRMRPDLVGMSETGEYYVLEAKGRSGPASKAAYDKAKIQVNQVRTINGQEPMRVALESYCLKDGRIKVRWRDPWPGRIATRYRVKPEEIKRKYYGWLSRAVAGGNLKAMWGDGEFNCVDISEMGVIVGLDSERAGKFARQAVTGVSSGYGPKRLALENYDVLVRRDGVLVGIRRDNELWAGKNISRHTQDDVRPPQRNSSAG